MSEAPARRPMWGAPVPLSNGLDTRTCKILDPPLGGSQHVKVINECIVAQFF